MLTALYSDWSREKKKKFSGNVSCVGGLNNVIAGETTQWVQDLRSMRDAVNT